MIRIEADLPPHEVEIFQGIEFIAKPSDSYNPEKAANQFAEFLESLYQQLPYDVVKILQKDPRISKFRECLTDKL